MIPAVPAKIENIEEARKLLLQFSIVLNELKKIIQVTEDSIFY
jgi:hypothetical protein